MPEMSVREDAVSGAVDGLKIAAIMFVIAIPGLIVRMAAGEWRIPLLVAPLYAATGIIAGGIVGMLRRWTRRWIVAMIVGFVAIYPASLGLLLAVGGRWRLVPLLLVCAVISGIGTLVAGTMIWNSARRTP